jgi:hypothetical protein
MIGSVYLIAGSGCSKLEAHEDSEIDLPPPPAREVDLNVVTQTAALTSAESVK